MLAMGVLAGFWVLSLLTYGYLSWGQGLEEEEEGAMRPQTGERPEPSITTISQPHLIFILADDRSSLCSHLLSCSLKIFRSFPQE